MLTERQRLEEELRFLRESFDIGVIDEAEFEQGKKRIQKKLDSLDETPSSDQPEQPSPITIREMDHENHDLKKEIDSAAEKIVEKAKEPQQEPLLEKKEPPKTRKKTEEPQKAQKRRNGDQKEEKRNGRKRSGESSHKSEQSLSGSQTASLANTSVQTQEHTQRTEESNIAPEGQPKPIMVEDKKESDMQSKEDEEESLGAGWIALIVILVVVAAFGLWIYNSGGNGNDGAPVLSMNEPAVIFACNSDADCVKDNLVGSCLNPATDQSKCTFEAKLSLKILTADCTSCSTDHTLSVLRQFFFALEPEQIPYNSVSGQALIKQFDIVAVPAYIFDGSLARADRYGEFRSSVQEVKGSFVLKNTVANANLFVSRPQLSARLDVFVKPGEKISKDTEKNLLEFTELFGDSVKIVRHSNNAELTQEFGINTFPTFVVNNQLRFSGLQSANTLKEHFCSMNKFAQCSKELTKSLV